MQKRTGSILLIASTCIGSGMIALPMILAKIGIIPSILLMIFTWLLMYFTSLITVELSLQAGKGLPLGKLGKRFSGKIAEIIGTGSFKLLSYALLAVYIYAGSSILQKLFSSTLNTEYSFDSIAFLYALAAVILFLFPIKIIDYVNRLLFTSLLVVIAILIIGLVSMINWDNLPLFAPDYGDISAWQILIPIVFTSFGFQGSCHTLVNYCEKNGIILKRALLWGSFIPMLVYIIWNSSILSLVHNENPSFYNNIINGKVDVGDLIEELTHIAQWQSIKILTWWISILAIVTSVLGVGIGLFDAIKIMIPSENRLTRNLSASLITILPAYIVAILIPNAFIQVLSFAGMILVIIAIIMPVYLLHKAKIAKLRKLS